MCDSPSKGESVNNRPNDQASSSDRTWFLLNCAWHDQVWVLQPTNKLEEPRPLRLNWRFQMSDDGYFTDQRYASLLESSRQLIAVIRNRGLGTGLSQRASSVYWYFSSLRHLLRWMTHAGFRRFGYLDAAAILQYQCSISNRKGKTKGTLARSTIEQHLYLFTYLYRFRNHIDDGLSFNPFPGRSHPQVAGDCKSDIGRLPHTPDAVTVALVQGAIDLVNEGASGILEARQIYAETMDSARRRGRNTKASTMVANRVLQHAAIELSGRARTITCVKDLACAIDMLYTACFVVISYLVGPRVSEILHLQAGCVQRYYGGSNDESIIVIVGSIFKKGPEYHGRPHRWVAPPPVVQSISVLEALSEGHRKQTDREDLWLRRCHIRGAVEWQHVCPGELEIIEVQRIARLLKRFSVWLDLPDHEGKSWQLSTHQGRKTFARFAALRDRTALFALAQHLGHRDRAVTDFSYSGTDYRLNHEIESAILDQSVAAWEQMLSASGLGGRAGAEIIAKRPRFRGARLKEDIKSYARMLADAGLALGVCDWGFCVYREAHSACLGNAIGPNPARREPSTCARCKNFAVSEQHRQFWVDQVDRHEALLNEPALPLQTLRIARERFEEARAVIQSIDRGSPEASKK